MTPVSAFIHTHTHSGTLAHTQRDTHTHKSTKTHTHAHAVLASTILQFAVGVSTWARGSGEKNLFGLV